MSDKEISELIKKHEGIGVVLSQFFSTGHFIMCDWASIGLYLKTQASNNKLPDSNSSTKKPRESMRSKMDRVHDYLKKFPGQFISPTEIGGEVGPVNAHSSWASPVCKRLHKEGRIERSDKGWYRHHVVPARLTGSDIIIGHKYRIICDGSYKNRVATAVFVSPMGDVTLRFKNGKEVRFHAGWLKYSSA